MDPNQLTNDKDFMSASPTDQHAYLSSQDADYAKASPADQQAYREHLGLSPQKQPAGQGISRNVLPPEQRHAMDSYGSASMYGATEAAKGVGDVAKGFGQMFDPRTHSPAEETAAKYAGPAGAVGLRMGKGLMDLGKQAMQVPGAVKDLAQSDDPMFALGMAAPRGAGQGVGQITAALAPKAIGAITGKIGELTTPQEANAAITEGLHVPSKSAKMGQAVKDVNAARPMFEDVKSQAELQQRIPGAKQQVWDPYQKAVDTMKASPVQGPDGPTTVGELEAERLKLSEQTRSLKAAKPTDKAGIMQKDSDLAGLATREKAVIDALDPELAKSGIDPKAIRRLHGNVKGVERTVSGKSTVTEPLKPYGAQKLIPHGIPRMIGGKGMQWNPIEAVRDLRAGQSGMLKPTDVGIERIFKKK